MGNHCTRPQLPHVNHCLDDVRDVANCNSIQSSFVHDFSDPGPCRIARSLSGKGLVIVVESVDELVSSLPFELDADLDHLYELHSASASAYDAIGVGQVASSDIIDYKRDVGALTEGEKGNQDNYAVLQVNDMANPWGLYMVADGDGPQGQLISTLLVHEVPSVLIQNPNFHSKSCMALHQSYGTVAEMVATCQYIDASHSGSSLCSVFLRGGMLHVAWVGTCKVVLGRVAARGDATPIATQQTGGSLVPVRPVGRKAGGLPPPQRALGAEVAAGAGSSPPPLLRAVDLTAASQSPDAAVASQQSFEPDSVAFGESHTGARRGFGHLVDASTSSKSNGDAAGGCRSHRVDPEVRRLKLKPDDVFVIIGSSGLWGRLSPAEAVTIVGQNLHRVACTATEALLAEARKRNATDSDDLTAIVLYLQGDRLVHGSGGASYWVDESQELLREAREHLAGLGCTQPSSFLRGPADPPALSLLDRRRP